MLSKGKLHASSFILGEVIARTVSERRKFIQYRPIGEQLDTGRTVSSFILNMQF